MMEKIRQIPYPGLRNIKTALAGTLCIVLYTLLGRVDGLALRVDGLPLACIAVFICMQDSIDKSWKVGKDRGIGTILGGVLASGVGMLRLLDQHLAVMAAAAFLGIVIYIYACGLLKIEGSITIGLATYIIIVFGPQAGIVAPVTLAFARTLDTIVGIVIGVLVNILLFRPRPERFRGHDTVNPVFHYACHEESHHKTIKWDGGETKELYIYPENAIYQNMDFDFRVAVNNWRRERSVLRKFPGYKRQVMLLDGEIHLSHKDQHTITLGRYEQDISMGDWQTECRGCGTELTLLTREGFTGKLELLYDEERRKHTNGVYTAFYCLEDGVKLRFENQGRTFKEELRKGDYVIISWFENGEESYKVEARREEAGEDPPVLMITCEHT